MGASGNQRKLSILAGVVVVMIIAYIPWIGLDSAPSNNGNTNAHIEAPAVIVDYTPVPTSPPAPAIAEVVVAPPPPPLPLKNDVVTPSTPGGSDPALVTDSQVTPDVTIDIDPFAVEAGGVSSPGGAPSVATMLAAAAAKPKERPNKEEVDKSFEGLDPILAKINGLELLKEVGVPIPPLSFTYDDSEEAKAKRTEEKVAEIVGKGMPEAVARLQAQLYERELLNKMGRAKHNRKRAIVRLVQEARLKKDAEDRDQRLLLAKMKQDSTAQMMAEAEEERKRNEDEKEADRKKRDARVAAEAAKVQEQKQMMAKIREDAIAKQNAENALRKGQEKEDKKQETKDREARDSAAQEDKRKMMEEFRNQMAAQMADQKRLAMEERLLEAQEARESRLRLESDMGIKKPLLDALA